MKTGPFSRALRGDKSAVVIDSWMLRGMGYSIRPRRSTVDEAIIRIRRLAYRFGWYPRDTQAAVWAGIIRAYYKSDTVPIYSAEGW